jgi:hypothetical protein
MKLMLAENEIEKKNKEFLEDYIFWVAKIEK